MGTPAARPFTQSLVDRASRALAHELVRRLTAAGYPEVRPAHSPVFAFLPREGMRLSDLAERAGMSKQAMRYLVADLIDAGLIDQVADPADGRAKLLRFTRRGLNAARTGAALYGELDAEIRGAIGGRADEAMRAGLLAIASRYGPT